MGCEDFGHPFSLTARLPGHTLGGMEEKHRLEYPQAVLAVMNSINPLKRRHLAFLLAGLALMLNCFAQNRGRGSGNPDAASVITYLGEASMPEAPLSVWYRQPARQWTEALPIGNGRLGAMVYGGVGRECLQLNEDTLWAGGPYDPANTNAPAALPEVRQLIFDGKYTEAERLISSKMMAKPLAQLPYETVGSLFLDFAPTNTVENYRRDLNLDTAVASVSYKSGGVAFLREVFSSPVDQVIVVRLTADKPGQITFAASMKTPQKALIGTEFGDTLVMSGTNGTAERIPGASEFEARVRVVASGGKTSTNDATVTVTGADSAILLIAAATSFKSYRDVSGNPEAITKGQIATAGKKTYKKLLAGHVAEHQRLFRRVELNLGQAGGMKSPTDERQKHFGEGNDPQFAALYFQFGRYLLISCSRPGGQPANLQGLWNESMSPSWGSKYTVNINTEMNYWPVDTANLGECIEPLTSMVLDLTDTGARTAREMYHARAGWCITIRIFGGRARRLTFPARACGRRAGRGCARTCGTTICSPGTRPT